MRARLLLVIGGILAAAGVFAALAGADTPVLTLPPPVTVFTSGSGATVDYTVTADDNGTSVTPSCDPASGAVFPRGTTTVNCTADNGLGDPIGTGSFDVTVVGPPQLTLPATITVDDQNANVSFDVSASDELGAVTPSCSVSSPHTFPVGTTTVSCTAGRPDPGAPTTSGSFDVTVVDTTPPPVPTLAGPSGTITDSTPTFSFTSAGADSFVCSLTGPTPSTADPCATPYTPGSLTDGSYTFSVSARDAAANTSASASTSFVVDTTAPNTTITSTLPALATVREATIDFSSSEGGSSFECSLDGASFSACSSPAALTGLPDGSHTFRARARDTAGNTDPTPAAVTWAIDATPPVLSPVGNLDKIVEAAGPAGTAVTFSVSASDNGIPLLPGAATCTPSSGFVFPLGATGVTCSATDDAGNIGTLLFTVTVVDTTPPTINAPNVGFTATDQNGISSNNPAVAAYLAGISASDLVSKATLTTNAPAVFPIGVNGLTVTAQDVAGNTATKNVRVTVLKPGTTPPPPPDLTPPGSVAGVKAKAGDRAITLTWRAPPSDVVRIEVKRSVVGESGTERLVYSGLATSHTSKGLRNGTQYRFDLAAFDEAGNSSNGVTISATPRALLLASPPPGARVSKPPVLRWAPVPSTYFNVQLFRKGSKVLSAWPTTARLQLTARWVYKGRSLRLSPGIYTWYVWPGLGARADARYGDLIGKSSFVVVGKK